ncbi:hypothetical protein EPI10_005809 [Gossypium australe]|uniref:Uncharacterized protein n=1 Tax=Gossypium australe TaxID=47621 RepID=A0A5B6WP53_9ROSI|nr:hypothetical protein EPI10_005809 [Gossypium australe]
MSQHSAWVETVNETLDEPELEEQMEKVVKPIAEIEIEQHPKLVSKYILFPSRDEAKFVSFLNIFTLNVNFSLLEINDMIPKYAKYLKEIMSRHKKLKKGEKININALVVSLVQPKRVLKDIWVKVRVLLSPSILFSLIRRGPRHSHSVG